MYKSNGGLVEDVKVCDNICQGCPCSLCHLIFVEVLVCCCCKAIKSDSTMLILVHGVRTCMCKTKQNVKFNVHFVYWVLITVLCVFAMCEIVF